MQFTFLDMAGKTLFIRDDAERAQWTQEEMTLDLEFPRLEDKVISIGQRIFFKDPTGASQIYEVKQARTLEPDNYQTIVAENICISELSDEHVDNSEIDNKTASNALQGVLNGTLWQVGDSLTNPTSSGDISRGSVWQAVLEIKDNWNVYIEPRVVLNSDGSIARYLDIVPTSGVWNGLRLSIDKNMLDPSVTFDDSEVVTAMYGYGGTIAATTPEGENTECTFKDVVWTATSQHPAKSLGQTYIEDPDATLEYGRNGRARFGFYQNTDITDPDILLEKTWESLQANSKPAISIDGTVADLYRMGYADKPIKLHDIALVEVNPAGYKDQIQIIRITTDLLDPSATTLTIGSYIPNIVYIERQTNESATGSRGGGGGNKSNETAWKEFRTTMEAYEDGTGMKIRSVQNDLNNTKEEVAVQEAQLEVAFNRITAEVTDRRNADAVLQGRITVEANRITQEVTERRNGDEVLSGRITVEKDRITQEVTDRTNADNTLQGKITVEANRITQEVTERRNGDEALSGRIIIEKNRITQEVTDRTNADNTLSGRITVESDRITQEVTRATTAEGTLSGRITVNADAITAEVTRAQTAEGTLSGRLTIAEDAITAEVTRATTAEGTLSGRITVNADAITSEVTRAQTAETYLYGRFTVASDAITAEVTRATNAESTLSGRLTVTENAISAEVTRAGNAETWLYGRVLVNADKISLVVSENSSGGNVVNAASIVAGINGQDTTAQSYVAISADQINLSGYVTMTSFNALSGTVNGILASGTFASNKITSTTINATGTLAASGTFNYGGHTIGSYKCTTSTGATFYALGYT